MFFGKLVGTDEFGNKYYKNKKDERCVIYARDIEATKITSDWFLWMHHTVNELPSDTVKKYNWQKEHTPNSTGTPDPYDQEETGVFEIGTKSILLDGAMLFNAAYFQNTTDGMLISSIVNAGSRNVNTDAEINGFEGNLLFYMNETTSVDLTWLKVDSEITALSLINPVNINNATARAPLPASLGGGLMLPIASTGGVLSVGATDAGLVYKFAGFMCLAPFNPFDTTGAAVCKGDNLGVPVDVSGNKLPQSPELSYSIGLNKDFVGDNVSLEKMSRRPR